jgi:hypothetical protein
MIALSAQLAFMKIDDGTGTTSSNMQSTLVSLQWYNKWIHIAYVFSGSTASIYANGTQIATSTLLPAPPNVVRTAASIFIGYSSAASAYAVYDDIKVWNVALTAGQIASDYASTGVQ